MKSTTSKYFLRNEKSLVIVYFFICLGIVPPNREETDEDKVLKGVVRVEMVQVSLRQHLQQRFSIS